MKVKPQVRKTWICLLPAYICMTTPASADPPPPQSSAPIAPSLLNESQSDGNENDVNVEGFGLPQWLCSASNTWDTTALSHPAPALALAPLPALPQPPGIRSRTLPLDHLFVNENGLQINGGPADEVQLDGLHRPLIIIDAKTSASTVVSVIKAIASKEERAVFAFAASDAAPRPSISPPTLEFAASQGPFPTITQMGHRFGAVLENCPTALDHRFLERTDHCLEFASDTTRLIRAKRCELDEHEVYGILTWALGRGSSRSPMALWEVEFNPTTDGTVFVEPNELWESFGPKIAEGTTWFELGNAADHLIEDPYHRVDPLLGKRPTKVRPVKGIPVLVTCHFDVFVNEGGLWTKNEYTDCPEEFHAVVDRGYEKATWYPHTVNGQAVPARFPNVVHFR